MPIQYQCLEGFVHVLPGDDLYPKNVTYDKSSHNIEQYRDKSFQYLRENFKNWHRMEQIDMHTGQLLCNIPGNDGHLDLNFVQSKL